MECAEAAASVEKTMDAAAAAAVEKNPKDPAAALEKTKDAAVLKKTKDAAVEKKTKEKKDKKGVAKNTKSQFKPPRPAEALGKAPAEEPGDEAAEAGADGGEDPVASQTSTSGGKGRKKAITDQLTNTQEDDLC